MPAAPPPGYDDDVDVVPPGEASNSDPGAAAELVDDDAPGGANMRLRSLPFPFGGAIVVLKNACYTNPKFLT